MCVARSPHCPSDFVAWLLRQDDLDPSSWWQMTDLRGNRALPLALRRQAFFTRSPADDSEHWDWLLADFMTEGEVLLLKRAGGGRREWSSPESTVLQQDLLMTGEELVALAELGKPGEELALLHPNTPDYLLEWLLDCGAYRATHLAPAHPHLPLARLEAFATYFDEENEEESAIIRAAAASNPNLPEDCALRLVIDCKEVQAALAGNRWLSPKVMQKLAAHGVKPPR